MSADNKFVILIADDDAGHARLIEKNLRRAGMLNRIERFGDGQEVLDFLFSRGEHHAAPDTAYLLLLDIRMPKIDGVEVLRTLKQHAELRKVPVTMLTTTDDPQEIARCYSLGCSHYIVKPVNCDEFAETIGGLARFVALVEVPVLSL
jgi:CheY-like chemotaxis protein